MDTREVVAQAHAAANSGDEGGHLSGYAENAVTVTPGNIQGGRDAMSEFSSAWQSACPDAQVVVVNQIVEGDLLAEEFTFNGTHTAPLTFAGRSYAPTGRPLNICGAIFIRVSDDKIVRERVYLDELAILAQLEATP